MFHYFLLMLPEKSRKEHSINCEDLFTAGIFRSVPECDRFSDEITIGYIDGFLIDIVDYYSLSALESY